MPAGLALNQENPERHQFRLLYDIIINRDNPLSPAVKDELSLQITQGLLII